MIAPSVLAADFSDIKSALDLAGRAEADWIHLDIMDGNFVPPISFGAQMTAAIRQHTRLPLDVHLMTEHPGNHLDDFLSAEADRITFHVEAETHPHRLAAEIRRRGAKSGIAIVPSTPVLQIQELLSVVDQVLVMTVNPGWGGQSLIPSTLEKIRELRRLREQGAGEYLICMDGGFGPDTAARIWDAGTDVAVMGSAFFGAENPQQTLQDCRKSGSR